MVQDGTGTSVIGSGWASVPPRWRRRLSAESFAVVAVLGLEQDLGKVRSDDVLARKLEDARLTETRRRVPKRRIKERAGSVDINDCIR